jgi:hypothetical protein
MHHVACSTTAPAMHNGYTIKYTLPERRLSRGRYNSVQCILIRIPRRPHFGMSSRLSLDETEYLLPVATLTLDQFSRRSGLLPGWCRCS